MSADVGYTYRALGATVLLLAAAVASGDEPTPVDGLSSPAAERFAERLVVVDEGDAEALFALAVWARGEGLTERADELLHRVLELDGDHGGARRALRQVCVDGVWMSFDDALECLAARVQLGHVEGGDLESLAALWALAEDCDQQYRIAELQVRSDLLVGDFAGASDRLDGLVVDEAPTLPPRLDAVREILTANPDGMYVLTEPFPAEGALLGESTGVLAAGPASLSDPRALAAALRDAAREHIQLGARQLAAGRANAPADPNAASDAYHRALDEFDVADAIVENIALSYKVEIARRRIDLIRDATEPQAASFDAEIAALGRHRLSRKAYRAKIARMLGQLGTVEANLQRILEIAAPYDRQLSLQIEWADAARRDVWAMSQMLRVELHDRG